MDYSEALGRLLSLTDFERVAAQATHTQRYDLRRVEMLLERLGNPHRGRPTVHIAGTKGKGSTAAIISSVLTAQGYRPGLFTSPHLHTFRERIRLQDMPVSEEVFISLVERLWPVVAEMNGDGAWGEVTVFEMLNAMAFVHFREEATFQVVEVGLGGRVDSTNVVAPEVCVITSISLDHTEILGDTVEAIARDKAGIIKPGAAVVVGPQAPEAMAVIREACREAGTPLLDVERECRWATVATSLEGQEIEMKTPWDTYRLGLPLLGRHQQENAVTALAALQALNQRGFTISCEALTRGFATVQWPARLEVLGQHPLLVADGAHNPYSARVLREALGASFAFERLLLVVGASADKNLEGIAEALNPGAHRIIVTRSRHPRSAPLETLARAFATAGREVEAVDGVGAALRQVLAHASPRDLVLVTGSLFVAAEGREEMLGIPPEVYPTLQPGTRVP